VSEVTFLFWVINILATILGETGGETVSMSMNLGCIAGTGIFAVLFITAVVIQIIAKVFHPFLYWGTIISATSVGTTLANDPDRSLGIGYAGVATVLFTLLIASLFVWYRTLGSVDVGTVSSPTSEWFYWVTIMFSQNSGDGAW